MADAGLGLTLPPYASGPNAVGWWGMWITMLGDATAFASLVFGFFFYWTASADFPPVGALHADAGLTALAAALGVGSWGLTLAARRAERTRRRRSRAAGAGGGPAGRRSRGRGDGLGGAGPLTPTSHVYPGPAMGAGRLAAGRTCGAGIVMQLYCLAGSFAGKMTPRHDADLRNVTLYWHFTV